MDYDFGTASLEQVSDLGPPPRSTVKRWVLELKLADKREREWRKTSTKILEKYRQEKAKKNSYNILWANTETLRPAIYNSLPKPDVRRRYKDADPLGKAVSEVLSRSIEYGLDTTDFNAQIVNCVLDTLLPGRGIARVRYVPSMRQVGVTADTHAEDNESHEAGGEALEGESEELEWEQTPIEHVQWDDYRQGPGKTWDEVGWIAFRHRMTRDELEKRFPSVGSAVPLDNADDEDLRAEKDEKIVDLFKTAEVWEIWNKEDREVVFLCQSYKESPLEQLPDPLNLVGFYPIPRPLYAVEDSSTTVPVPLYELYREQAEELDRISGRINTLIKGLKMRGIYDATLSELSEIMRGEDNDLIPAQNVTALLDRGGLEKAIWWMPIEQAATVIKVLYEQREQCKQVIYEITGISDILRGSTNAAETATAQSLKSQWGSARLKRLQADVQRFVRDLIRLQAEIIAEKFQPETLMQMTGLQFPTAQQAQMAMLQWKQQSMMAQQQGQQPPPQPQVGTTWEDILGVLRNDAQRTYKVDVETDSTIAATIEQDMQGLRDVLGGITELITGLGPAVQMGAMPIEALKELVMTVCRRSKMGTAVEDALDKIQAPPPQSQDQSAQVKAQADLQAQQAKIQADGQMQLAKQQHEAQLDQQRNQLEAQRADLDRQHQAQLEQLKAQFNAQLETQRLTNDRWKAQLDAETKLAIANIAASTTLQNSQMGIDAANQKTAQEQADTQQTVDIGNLMQDVYAKLDEMIQANGQPKTIERGPDGRAVSISGRPIQRGPDGKIVGLQ